ncbi:flagellar biosynthesis anti-sigma factor FlgM [Planctobacterium marinum]|uniref:flagellar biosynthesis anti-sigma factor FlgM n=1 Tax=Planctobacterium marinum TaxID=1631968 RepID=UPI001E3C99F8|nr:flagellar biosynthesis anti-sigma factor FlgM [Planctobacterium marinum]MCC2606288.1 flagellar biosynthesis anti-sigma factor FlgM [Planctobacterium marinum]
MAINNVNGAGQKPQLESQRLNQQQTQQGQSANTAQQAQTASAAPRQDSVSLTQSAQQLANVQKKGNDAPVNQDKVDKLKAAIQNGSYKIDAEQLASKISKAESDLFGLSKG